MIRLRIKEIAEQKQISISQLAKLADVDYKTVRKIFRDPQVVIDLFTLDKLCWALEVTPAELIYYEPTPPLIWQKRMGLAGEEQARHEIEEEEQERDRKPQ
jgi:DNA-binding Xre family transcriptional regulator